MNEEEKDYYQSNSMVDVHDDDESCLNSSLQMEVPSGFDNSFSDPRESMQSLRLSVRSRRSLI